MFIDCRRKRNILQRDLLAATCTGTQFYMRDFHRVGGDVTIPSLIRGIGYLYDNTLNKGLAFTITERQKLGIHGMLPPVVFPVEEQVEIVKWSLNQYDTDEQKYVYLQDLQIRNERLYYRVLSENMEELLPVVYNPTMKVACMKLNFVYRRPRGIFISAYDKGHVSDILNNWPEPVRAICVTDGSRIFGVGDVGAYGIAIPIGKLAVYTVAARIKPFRCLPVIIDVGTDRKDLLQKRWYIGIRQKRIPFEQEEELLDEFILAAYKRFGNSVVIHLEDFRARLQFCLLEKYREKYCLFSGDKQIPGCLVLSGLISAIKITNTILSENKILFFGAGLPAVGSAEMCVKLMMEEGLLPNEALQRVWLMDHHGLVVKGRDNIKPHVVKFARDGEHLTDLLEVIRKVEPSVLIGLSRMEGAFTPEILQEMAKLNSRPIIFAMGNPCGKPECSAEDAIKYTKGCCIFAYNEVLSRVFLEGKTYEIACANNAMVFPGIVLGAMLSQVTTIPDEIFVKCAKALSDFMPYSEIEKGKIYPPIRGIKDYALKLAEVVIEKAYELGLATYKPRPPDILEFIKKGQYKYEYEAELPGPVEYEWVNLLKMVEPKNKSILEEQTSASWRKSGDQKSD